MPTVSALSMQRALSCVLKSRLLLAFPLLASAFAAPPVAQPAKEKVTVVLDFKGPHSDRSVDVMKSELESILSDAGVSFTWSSPKEASEKTSENLVVVSFKGKCILEPIPYLYDERGPLASTFTSAEGQMLPFSEVACDTVTNSIRSAMFAGDYNKADLLLGRALGRVVAHEIVHIITKSPEHSHEGVQKPALSGSQLIADHLKLSDKDVTRIQQDLHE
jgi:hypothetical protein